MIYICRALCPNRHCVAAGAIQAEPSDPSAPYEEPTTREIADKFEDALLEAVNQGKVPGECKQCDAPAFKWTITARPTEYATLEKAQSIVAAILGQAAMSEVVEQMTGQPVAEVLQDYRERKAKASNARNN